MSEHVNGGPLLPARVAVDMRTWRIIIAPRWWGRAVAKLNRSVYAVVGHSSARRAIRHDCSNRTIARTALQCALR